MIELDPSAPPVTPRDAATVILVRDEADGFSVFMVKRHAKSGFMAGAYVFPGGTLDEGDAAPGLLARLRGRSADEAAAMMGEDDGTRGLALHVAALRETFEEAGVLLGDGADEAELAASRAALNDGAPLLPILEEHDITLRADALTPWSRWVTPTAERRRYDARFFLARAPRAQEAAHDRVEVTAGEWLAPHAALEKFEAGVISLPPPTLRTVEQLAGHRTIDDAIAAARARVPAPVQPELHQDAGVMALVLPGDPAHSIDERRIDGPTRFVLEDGKFRSVDP